MKVLFWIIAGILLVGAAGYVLFGNTDKVPEEPAPTNNVSDLHVTAGGDLSFVRPPDFGLAVRAEQVLVESVVPPCAEGFDYCLYYNADTHAGTNFESAGLRIQRRDDLAGEDACLRTPPTGYSGLEARVSRFDTYQTSVFSPVRSAGAGHASEGAIYRLAGNGFCYEFETRVGITQLGNYEPGTVEEFTEADRQQMERRLSELLRTIRFADGRDGPTFP